MKEKILEKYNAFKARNINYYKKAFLKQEQENTFNWSACLLGLNWLVYRRMWLVLMAYTLISPILIAVSSTVFQSYGINLENSADVIDLCAMLIRGYYGNSLYRLELKWKIKNGYNLNPAFSPTSLRMVLFIEIITLLSIILLQNAIFILITLLGSITINRLFYSFLYTLILLFIYAIVFYYEYHTYRTDTTTTTPNEPEINQYLEKSGNDISVISAIFITILSLISTILVASLELEIFQN